MRDKTGTLLGVESGEESTVSMLLTQSVFLGIFFAAFDITAHSLFLSIFDEKMLARGYALSGIAGIIFTSVYYLLQTRIKYRLLALINLSFVAAVTVLLWLALIFSPTNLIIFIVFILAGPLNILLLIIFWRTTEYLIARSKGKRLVRIADAGLLIGISVMSFAIPILISLKLGIYNILLFSLFSVFVVSILQIVIGNKFSLNTSGDGNYSGKSEIRNSLDIIFSKDSYIRIIGIFALLSVLAAYFIQYSFLAVTREQYPAATDMARFLGLFTGSMILFVLLLKQVVYSYLVHKFSLRTCLFISPVLIAFLAALAVASGALTVLTPEAGKSFLIFFIVLALSRLISKSLRDSVESPAFKTIWKSSGQKFKPEIWSGMNAALQQAVIFFSGLILTLFGLISFIKLIHFSLLLLLISLLWLYIAFRLYAKYRNSVLTVIENGSDAAPEIDFPDVTVTFKNNFAAYITFRKYYFNIVCGDYSVLHKVSNRKFFEKIINYTSSANDVNLLPVLRRISILSTLDDEGRKRSDALIESLQKYSTSLKPSDNKYTEALKVLSGTRKPQTTEILRLLRDNSLDSKRLAIYMIGKFRLTDLLSEVCECLIIPGLTYDATEVLRTMGSEIESELVRYYLITSGNLKLSKTLLELLGESCTRETVGFMFSRLWSNSRQLKEIAVKCLIKCKFNPSLEEKQRLEQLVSDTLGLITWNLSAKVSLKKDKDDYLLKIINKEIDRSTTFLFNILSIAYNSGYVAMIRNNLDRENIENLIYALEITDILVSDTVKRKLISFLDIVPDEVKLKNLFQFYPGEIPAHQKLLEDIINRDYNLISLWTKACVLRSIAGIEGADMAESVTALLFSPEELIQEEAASLIKRLAPGLYHSASGRIPEPIRKRLDKIITGENDAKELLFEKAQFLAKIFPRIQEDELLSLAGEMEYFENYDPEKINISEGCLIWPLESDPEYKEVYVVYEGENKRLTRRFQDDENLSFYFLDLNAVEEFYYLFPDKSFEVLKYIDNNEEQ
jgi:ATP:ADP antiporter, AAA family